MSVADRVARGAVTVVGVGNRWGGDDAVGPAVCDALVALRDGRRCGELALAVVELGGDVTDLVDRWSVSGTLLVVDASKSGSAPGTIRCLREVDALGDAGAGRVSSHGVGLADVIGFCERTTPRAGPWEVIAVEGSSFEPLAPLTAEVAHAIPEVVDLVVRRCAGTVLDRGDSGRRGTSDGDHRP